MSAPFDPSRYDRLSSGSVPGHAALQDLAALDGAGFTDVTPLYQLVAVHSWLARPGSAPPESAERQGSS